MPKIAKPKIARPPRLPKGHTAFQSGGSRAFNDPQTMAQPDQAFSAAMAPQGGGGAMPIASPPEG